MKVLLLHDYGVLAGGAERITVDLREGLRSRGHDVRIFASTASPRRTPAMAARRIPGRRHRSMAAEKVAASGKSGTQI